MLQKLGLSEKGAKIYLATLSLGVATVQAIAARAELKRPTVYVHLKELLAAGFVEIVPSGKKELFKATDPVNLEKRAEREYEEIKKIVPELKFLQKEVIGRPLVSVMEGRKALEQIYKEICQANNLRFWSDLGAVEDYFQEMFVEIAEAVNKNEIRAREIIADTAEAKKSSKRYAATAGKTYSSRIAARSPGIFNDNVIYGDTVAMFRIHHHNLFVILIKEPTIAETMKTIFDMAWESGKPFVGR